jgi:hypothetical protein
MQVLALAYPLTKDRSTRTMIITTHKQFPQLQALRDRVRRPSPVMETGKLAEL